MQKKEAKDMTYQRIHKMCRIFGWIQILLMWFPKESGKPAHAVAFNPSLTCNICMLPSTVEGKKTRYRHLCSFCEQQKNYFGVKNDDIQCSNGLWEIMQERSTKNRRRYLLRALGRRIECTQGCLFNCDINTYIYIHIYT